MKIEEIQRLMKLQTTPIDYDALIAAGILEKDGSWYIVHRWNDMPEHAQAQVSTLDSGGGGKPSRIRFHKR